MKSINPYNNQLIKEYDAYSIQKVNEILIKVNKSFNVWSNKTIDERASLFVQLANYLIEHKARLAELATLEMGKPIAQAEAELIKCASLCEFYAKHTKDFLAPKLLESSYKKSFVNYEPIGAVLAVMPWNYPYWQVFRFLVPNLMAGNVGVLKHASNVSGCALAIEQALEDVGFTNDVFRTLLISSSQVKSVIENDVIKAVTLTGSEYAGGQVAMQAGEQIKKTVLELGGNDAFIVLADADVELAVKGAVMGRYQNNGQSCIASKRFFIHEDLYDQFTTRLKLEVEAFTIGNPLEKETFIGPLAKPSFVEELHNQVQKSVALGASVLTGGQPLGELNQFYQPTILENITIDMPAFKEELFGPVAACVKFSSAAEVVQLANNSKYGLGGTIWSKNIDKAIELAKQIETGTVTINDVVKSDQRIPFGGIKASGYGSELAQDGQLEFMNHKVIHVNT